MTIDAAVRQAIVNGINRVVEAHGEEVFIACGYAAHDALIACISEELLAQAIAKAEVA